MSLADSPVPKVRLPGWLLRRRPPVRDSFLLECASLALGLETMRYASDLFVAVDPASGRRLAFHGAAAPSTARAARSIAQDRELVFIRLRSAGLYVLPFRSFQVSDPKGIAGFARTLGYPLRIAPHAMGVRWSRGEFLGDKAAFAGALEKLSEAPLDKGRPMTHGRVVVSAAPRGEGRILVVSRWQPLPLLVRVLSTPADPAEVDEVHSGFHRLAREALDALPGASLAGVEIFAEDFMRDPAGQAAITRLSVFPRLLVSRASWGQAWRAALTVLGNELPNLAEGMANGARRLTRVLKARGVVRSSSFVEAARSVAEACQVRILDVGVASDEVDLHVEGRATYLALVSMMIMANQLSLEGLPDTLEFSERVY